MNKQITPDEALEILQNIKDDITDFRDIIDDGVIVGSSVTSDEELAKLFDFIDQQIKSHEPLTDEERKIFDTLKMKVFIGGACMVYGTIGHYYFEGVGHSQAEAERDAFNQWKGWKRNEHN